MSQYRQESGAGPPIHNSSGNSDQNTNNSGVDSSKLNSDGKSFVQNSEQSAGSEQNYGKGSNGGQNMQGFGLGFSARGNYHPDQHGVGNPVQNSADNSNLHQNHPFSQFSPQSLRHGFPSSKPMPGSPMVPPRPPSAGPNMNAPSGGFSSHTQSPRLFSGQSISQPTGPTPTLNQLLQSSNPAHRYQHSYGEYGMQKTGDQGTGNMPYNQSWAPQRPLASYSPQQVTAGYRNQPPEMINNTLRSLQHKLEELVESLEGVETEVKRLTVLLNEKERENTNLKAELDELKEMIKSNEIAAEVVESVTDGDPVPSPPGILTQDQRSNHPVLQKKECDYMGMFEYRKEDEHIIVKHLIRDFKPTVAISLLPGLPAYVLFMCIRHIDFTNNEDKLKSLLTATINAIKGVIYEQQEDLDTTVLWLSNTLRLLHNLQQYSGDKTLEAKKTQKLNEQCLQNLDLSEYQQVLSDNAGWIYQKVIRNLEERVQPIIVPAILGHEAISGLCDQKPAGMQNKPSSVVREVESPVDVQKALDSLLQQLSTFHRSLRLHRVDHEVIIQVFRELFYFICARSLNRLLLVPNMCHRTKGMQIRCNLTRLEQWIRDQGMQETNVPDTLQPIIQAAQLLQTRKTDEDVQSVCDMCEKLSPSQIIRILYLFTRTDEFEERVSISFIRKIQETLKERSEPQEQVYRSWGQSSVETEELCRQSESSFAHLILLLCGTERTEQQKAL